MKKILIFIISLCLSSLALAEIKVKIHEPIRFKNVNTKSYGDLVVGEGALEIFSTNIKEDFGKKLKFRFTEKGIMTNRKKWIVVDKFTMAKEDQDFVLETEKRIVKFYAFIKKRNLNKHELDGSLVEGEYLGYAPIVIEQYGKPINRPMPLPSDKPTILPNLPDENKPTILPETEN
ncbi:hypothetical protein [Fusobacterium perfoetens]|uniref:hypothetical protein n=1 Tax=Fusobacterium perfoetens TaxID=852 RepID=UPI0004814540|nr:hypothetical protein [Fusobacterium perfoetens]MCI6152128.1 hypothetical protein [Fusobacterium perfoetens]MDY3237981.1 hypothetical protein [Fusobacterium perfoetens]